MNTNVKITCDVGDDRCRIASARLEKDIFVKTHLHTSPIVVKKIATLCTNLPAFRIVLEGQSMLKKSGTRPVYLDKQMIRLRGLQQRVEVISRHAIVAGNRKEVSNHHFSFWSVGLNGVNNILDHHNNRVM